MDTLYRTSRAHIAPKKNLVRDGCDEAQISRSVTLCTQSETKHLALAETLCYPH